MNNIQLKVRDKVPFKIKPLQDTQDVSCQVGSSSDEAVHIIQEGQGHGMGGWIFGRVAKSDVVVTFTVKYQNGTSEVSTVTLDVVDELPSEIVASYPYTDRSGMVSLGTPVARDSTKFVANPQYTEVAQPVSVAKGTGPFPGDQFTGRSYPYGGVERRSLNPAPYAGVERRGRVL
jgi:hypothetical protein